MVVGQYSVGRALPSAQWLFAVTPEEGMFHSQGMNALGYS